MTTDLTPGDLPPPTSDVSFAPPPAAETGRLDVPAGLPGSDAQLPHLPADTPTTRAERLKAIEALFPPLADLGPDPVPTPGPGLNAVTVDDLISQAKRQSPLVAQAAAEVERNRGQWIQAGLYPNPTVGYQTDQLANQGTAGQEGGFINQTFITAGKLRLAKAVAYYDWMNAKLKLRRQEVDLARQVRLDYFAALVAAENVRVSRAIAGFGADVYRRQVANVRGGQSAPFEANALRAVVGQSRTNLIAARNRYLSAWKQLAATLSSPDLPPTPLAGRVDAPLPRYQYDALQARMLAGHTELVSAQNLAAQADRSLTLERRRPIPDVQNNLYFQQDTQLNSFQMGIQMGVTVPLWNRNQGNILAARATIARQGREAERVRNDLVRTLADSFERYETGREQLALYRDQILPDLVRAFRGVYERYQVEPDKVNYNDIVTAQQNFAAQLTNYLQALQGQWQAVADVTAAVQADDPFELTTDTDPALPDTWPAAGPGGK